MKKIILIFFLLLLLPLGAASKDVNDTLKEQYDKSGIAGVQKSIPSSVKDDLYNIGEGKTGIDNITNALNFKNAMGFIINKLFLAFKSEAKLFIIIFVIIILYLVFEIFFTSFSNKSFENVVNVTITVCLILAIFNSLFESVTASTKSINEISTFCKTLIPVMCGLMVSSGQPVSATAFNGLLFIACEICTYIASGVVLPLVNIYFGFIIAQSINLNVKLNNFTEFLKKSITWILGIMFTIFLGIMTLQSLISGAADSVAKRTIKFAVGGLIPVAGGVLGEAMETVFSCANSVKSATGIFGIVVITLIIIAPLLSIFAKYLVFKLLSLFAELLGATRFSALLNNFSSAFGILISLTLGTTILLIASFTILLMSGVGK